MERSVYVHVDTEDHDLHRAIALQLQKLGMRVYINASDDALIDALTDERLKTRQMTETLTACQAENTRLSLLNRELEGRIANALL